MTGTGQTSETRDHWLLPATELRQLVAAGRVRSGAVGRILAIELRTVASVPLMAFGAPAGFPSPAEDYEDRPLDFNELLIVHPSATFVVKVIGDSMAPVILAGDLAIVDRALPVVDGAIVLALLGNEFTIKRYRCKGGTVWLKAENPAYPNVVITEDSGFEVWGVVPRCIRIL